MGHMIRTICKILFFFISINCQAQPGRTFYQQLTNPGGSPPASRVGIIFQSTEVDVPGFKQDIPTQIGPSWLNQQSCCSYSVIDTPFIRSGANSLRFSINSTDPSTSNRKRSEITLPNDPNGPIERWYGFSQWFKPSIGVAALAETVITSGRVTTINLLNGGSGYTSTPTVIILDDGSGFTTTATATCTVSAGQVTSVTITNQGSGYLGPPQIFFVGGGVYNGWVPDPQPLIIWQFHQDDVNGSPPFAFYVRDGYFEVLRTISATIDGGWEVRPPYDSRYPRMQLPAGSTNDVPLTPGQWYDWVIHMKWTDQNDGYIQIWMNGQLVFERLNTLTNYTNGAAPNEGGNYMKLGVYWWRALVTGCNCIQKYMVTNSFRIGDASSNYYSVFPAAY